MNAICWRELHRSFASLRMTNYSVAKETGGGHLCRLPLTSGAKALYACVLDRGAKAPLFHSQVARTAKSLGFSAHLARLYLCGADPSALLSTSCARPK